MLTEFRSKADYSILFGDPDRNEEPCEFLDEALSPAGYESTDVDTPGVLKIDLYLAELFVLNSAGPMLADEVDDSDYFPEMEAGGFAFEITFCRSLRGMDELKAVCAFAAKIDRVTPCWLVQDDAVIDPGAVLT